jgi:vacuolar-type H+-ATPase subunit H
MPERSNNVVAEIARIEQQADEVVEKARAEAAEIRERSGQDVAELVKSTNEEMEQAKAKLAEEYESETEQALTQIDVEFVKEQERLGQLRNDRMDKLVEWTALQIREQLADHPGS